MRFFNHIPRIALISYSNFGSNIDETTSVVIEATKILREKHPDWILDGDVQANVAVRPDILEESSSFQRARQIRRRQYVYFPRPHEWKHRLQTHGRAGRIRIDRPNPLGNEKACSHLQLGSSVTEIVNIAAIAVVDAQRKGGMK